MNPIEWVVSIAKAAGNLYRWVVKGPSEPERASFAQRGHGISRAVGAGAGVLV